MTRLLKDRSPVVIMLIFTLVNLYTLESHQFSEQAFLDEAEFYNQAPPLLTVFDWPYHQTVNVALERSLLEYYETAPEDQISGY